MKIIGIEKRSGVYKEKGWTNYHVFVQRDNGPESWGTVVTDLKVSVAVLNSVLSKYQCLLPSDLVGVDIDQIYYDQFRNVSMF